MRQVQFIPAQELRVESVRAGDQNAAEDPRGVKLEHIPTGLSVIREVYESRLENTEAALTALNAMVTIQSPETDVGMLRPGMPTISPGDIEAAQRRLRDGSGGARVVDERRARVQTVGFEHEVIEANIAATRQRIHTAFDTALDEMRRLVEMEQELLQLPRARP